MSIIKRRHFLQCAGSTLATLGLSQFDLVRQANSYGKVLAQGTPGRKLALLVGVNAYSDGIRSLEGCLTDVELQRELLIHRFGFHPNDILVVSDTESLKPTRQTILEAFESHLIQQAKPNDVVVFHFSGHGSLVRDPAPLPIFKDSTGKSINGTIVPSDRATDKPEQVRDIMGRTLFLLMRALQTENVTVVLDSCHSEGGTRGNLTVRSIRSRLNSGEALPSPEELEYQQRWLSQLKVSNAEFEAIRRKGVAKGVAIGSAQYDQLSVDAPFDGFTAGAFTYLLTRYLWQHPQSEAIQTVFTKLKLSTKDVANAFGMIQEPIYSANPERNGQQPVYFLTPTAPSAEAVVRKVSNGEIEFWLGGVSSRSLEAMSGGGIFTLIDSTRNELGEVVQTSRRGLVGYGKLRTGTLSDVKPGTLMWEQVRGVPADLNLRIGLDPSLGNQRSQAARALQSVNRVAVVTVGQGNPVDYLLGRMTAPSRTRLQQQKMRDLPAVGSVGLFTAGLKPLSATFSRAQETIPAAIKRLQSRFQSLLAVRILQLAVGSDRSARRDRLNLTATVVQKGSNRAASVSTYQFKTGTEFQVKVENNEAKNLYIAALVISDSGSLTVLYPYANTEDAALVGQGEVFLTPKEGDDYQFKLTGSGFIEILTLASTQPLRGTLKAVQKIAGDRGFSARSATPLNQGNDSLDVVGALLSDLNRNSRSTETGVEGVGKQAVNTTQVSAISTFIEVVAG